MNIRPLNDLVIAEKLAPIQTGAIVIPEMAHRHDRYTVVAVGPKTRDVAPGDVVHIHPTAESTLTTHGNRVFRHVREKNILAVERLGD